MTVSGSSLPEGFHKISKRYNERLTRLCSRNKFQNLLILKNRVSLPILIKKNLRKFIDILFIIYFDLLNFELFKAFRSCNAAVTSTLNCLLGFNKIFWSLIRLKSNKFYWKRVILFICIFEVRIRNNSFFLTGYCRHDRVVPEINFFLWNKSFFYT